MLILDELLKKNIKFDWVFLDYLLYEVIIFFNKKKIILRCSYKLIPLSLKKFYPTLSKIEKLYFPYEVLNNWNPNLKTNLYTQIYQKYNNLSLLEYFKIYNQVDCKILKEGLLTFFKTLDNLKIFYTNKNYTCGSIALMFYIKNWNKINLKLNKKWQKIARKAYYGGRCEVFGNPLENKKILHFDFSGMYQQCMLEALPYEDFVYCANNKNTSEPGFYNIKIKYKNNIPLLPVRDIKLLFPEGVIEGWYWYEELEFFKKNFTFEEFTIKEAILSTNTQPILKEFIETLYEIKKFGGAHGFLGKLLINSFYGRLAIDENISNIILTKNISDEKTFGKIGEHYILKKNKNKKTKANVAIAAAITSKARIKLYEAFLDINKIGGRILYCDTDSIFSEFNINANVENIKIGKHIFFDTNKEDTVIKDAVFVLPKTYGLILKNNKEIIKIKGFNNLNINFIDFKNMFYNEQKDVKIQTNLFKKKNFLLQNELIIKSLDLTSYNKRIWCDNYKNTKPLNLKVPI